MALEPEDPVIDAVPDEVPELEPELPPEAAVPEAALEPVAAPELPLPVLLAVPELPLPDEVEPVVVPLSEAGPPSVVEDEPHAARAISKAGQQATARGCMPRTVLQATCLGHSLATTDFDRQPRGDTCQEGIVTCPATVIRNASCSVRAASFFQRNAERACTGRSEMSPLLRLPAIAARPPVAAPCFDAFWQERDYICRTLRRLGVPRSDIEDSAHEVLLVLHRNWDKFDSSRSLRAYLFGVAFRVASWSRRRTWRETAFPWVDREDASGGPDRALEAKRASALVLAALTCIPLPRRAVLAMHELDEVPMRDVARELSIPLFTAYSRLRKARREFEREVVRLENETQAILVD